MLLLTTPAQTAVTGRNASEELAGMDWNRWPESSECALIDLSFKKYEGTPATSGVVYTSQPQSYIPRLDESAFQFRPFDRPVEFTREFFAFPASHRYVDGKNSFYLVDNLRQTLGVLRAKDPREFGIVERCGGVHVATLLERMPGRAWVAYVGLNQDVHVLTAQGVRLRWDSNHWYMRDDGLLGTLLRDAGCDEQTTGDLTSVLYALSELRMGTAVLIPKDVSDRPPVAGQIDSSLLGDTLRSQFEGGSLSELIRSHAAIGVFSSDGLTTVSPDGALLGCGEIIELGSQSSGQGGGRSQAALRASACGTAIKVSEDGPISVYRAGDMLIRL